LIDRLQDTTTIVVSAHRGLKCACPENTIPAFRRALEAGVDMLEFDLRLTKDKRLAIIHDDTVDRTTNGTGAVSEYTWAELQRLDAGGWFDKAFEGCRVPALEELCELLAASGANAPLLNVEIKPSADAIDAADRAVETLRGYGFLERCVFTSFDASVVAHVHDTYGLRTQGFPAESMRHFVDGPGGTYSKMWAAAFSMEQLTPQRVRELRERGLQTWCYCPDTERDVFYALGCGVSVMTCNDPFPAMRLRRRLEADDS